MKTKQVQPQAVKTSPAKVKPSSQEKKYFVINMHHRVNDSDGNPLVQSYLKDEWVIVEFHGRRLAEIPVLATPDIAIIEVVYQNSADIRQLVEAGVGKIAPEKEVASLLGGGIMAAMKEHGVELKQSGIDIDPRVLGEKTMQPNQNPVATQDNQSYSSPVQPLPVMQPLNVIMPQTSQPEMVQVTNPNAPENHPTVTTYYGPQAVQANQRHQPVYAEETVITTGVPSASSVEEEEDDSWDPWVIGGVVVGGVALAALGYWWFNRSGE